MGSLIAWRQEAVGPLASNTLMSALKRFRSDGAGRGNRTAGYVAARSVRVNVTALWEANCKAKGGQQLLLSQVHLSCHTRTNWQDNKVCGSTKTTKFTLCPLRSRQTYKTFISYMESDTSTCLQKKVIFHLALSQNSSFRGGPRVCKDLTVLLKCLVAINHSRWAKHAKQQEE